MLILLPIIVLIASFLFKTNLLISDILFVDELAHILIGGKSHADNYSKLSLFLEV